MAVSLDRLCQRLIREGQAMLAGPKPVVHFTGIEEQDALVRDLGAHPHAFVLAALVDRRVVAEIAWAVPAKIRDRLGSFEFADVQNLSEKDWLRLLKKPPAAHRYPQMMAKVLYLGTQRIAEVYQGGASRIWSDRPTSARIVRRFLEFHGAGPKIATMASNILARDFRIPLRDYRYIDISADVQIRRVMARLGFVDEGAKPEVVVYAARDLNPDFPGIFDLALWDIGRTVCRPTNPRCPECPLNDLCTFGRGQTALARTSAQIPTQRSR